MPEPARAPATLRAFALPVKFTVPDDRIEFTSDDSEIVEFPFVARFPIESTPDVTPSVAPDASVTGPVPRAFAFPAEMPPALFVVPPE